MHFGVRRRKSEQEQNENEEKWRQANTKIEKADIIKKERGKYRNLKEVKRCTNILLKKAKKK